jgi:hypothetical protein
MKRSALALVAIAAVVLVPGADVPAQVGSKPGAVQSDTSNRLSPAAVAGCYDLSRTSWYDVPRARIFGAAWPDTVPTRRDSTLLHEHEPPRHVRLALDTVKFQFGSGLQLEPIGPDGYGQVLLSYRMWGVRGDSVVAIWSTGFAGVRLNLRPTAYGLEGVAVADHDVVGPFPIPAARVTLLRTRCRD